MAVGLHAAGRRTPVGLIAGVDVGVFLAVGRVGKAAGTACVFALKWFFSGVRPAVDLEVLGAGEGLVAVGDCAGKGLLASVNSDVIDEFILGSERLFCSDAVLPLADVHRSVERAEMSACDVLHDIRQAVEAKVAGVLCTTVVCLLPLAADRHARAYVQLPISR